MMSSGRDDLCWRSRQGQCRRLKSSCRPRGSMSRPAATDCPSSRSFGAVNREQFYVSISRGRERVHVFTDDADLLARRVTDSHTRTPDVELQALRDGLAKLGFIPKERLEEVLAHGPQPPVSASRQDF